MGTSSRSPWTITPARLFLIVFLIILAFTCFLSFPKDDGLRHVGVAFSGEPNWGNVYPFSCFSENSGYSPWYGYDFILINSLSLFKNVPPQSSTVRFIYIKLLSLIFVFIVFWGFDFEKQNLNANRQLPIFYCYPQSVPFCLLSQFFLRSMSVRPFVFGTIFLIYSFGQTGYLKGAISSGVIDFSVPLFVVVLYFTGHILPLF